MFHGNGLNAQRIFRGSGDLNAQRIFRGNGDLKVFEGQRIYIVPDSAVLPSTAPGQSFFLTPSAAKQPAVRGLAGAYGHCSAGFGCALPAAQHAPG